MAECAQEEWVTITILSRLLGCTRMTVWNRIQRGRIKAWQLVDGGAYYISRSEVDRVLELEGKTNETVAGDSGEKDSAQ